MRICMHVLATDDYIHAVCSRLDVAYYDFDTRLLSYPGSH